MYNSIIRLCQISSRPQMPLFTLKKNGYLSAHPASGIRFAVHIDLISIVLTHVSTNHVPSYDERLVWEEERFDEVQRCHYPSQDPFSGHKNSFTYRYRILKAQSR